MSILTQNTINLLNNENISDVDDEGMSLIHKFVENNLIGNANRQQIISLNTQKKDSIPLNEVSNTHFMDEDNSQLLRKELIEDWQMHLTPPLTQPKQPKYETVVKREQTFYELPIKVADLYKKLRKIERFYDWQDECLNLKCLTNGNYSNLFYLSPTSGGKTLVAEILILKCLLLRKKSCIFVMPYVAIVQEKVKSMQEFADQLDFHCEEYANFKGRLPPMKRRKKQTLYICTIEKANGLINSLIETNRFESEIGLVVADELHMIGDGPRGAILETLLTKVKHSGKDQIQIVATTATLDNKIEVANFLNAHLYERNFRPVELKEYVKFENKVFLVDSKEDQESRYKMDRVVDFGKYTQEMKLADPDYLVGLVLETVPDDSCLIFCSTKRNCENVATLLAKYLPKEFTQHKRNEKLALYNEIRAENNQQICPVLRQTIPYGIAYHHSGLTSEERQLIEQAYKDGVLCVITCTSTLAAGVNLPAKRVIIRSPYVGTLFLSTHQYRQMIGRAGRAGLTKENFGESILIINQKSIDRSKIDELVSGPMTKCISSLNCDDFKSIRQLILSLIDLKVVENGAGICEFFEKTLYFTQNKVNQEQNHINVISALNYLAEMKYIEFKSIPEQKINSVEQLATCSFSISKLGIAAIKCSIDLDLIPKLHADLTIGLKNMVLSTNLHLLYLCTPYDLVNAILNVDFEIYTRKFCNLNEDEVKCANIIGVQEQIIHKKRFQKAINTKFDEAILKRFYVTLIIYDLWKTNNSIWQVSSEFNLDRGFVQQIIQSAASFSNNILHFCENLDEFWPYKNLLQEFCKRLQYNCVSLDIIPLLELDNVRLPRAKQLFTSGYTTLESISNATPNDLSSNIKNMPLNVAKKIIKSARALLTEKANLLKDEVDNILEQMSDHQKID